METSSKSPADGGSDVASVRVETVDRIWIINVCSGNADESPIDELMDALADARDNTSVEALLITGDGRGFLPARGVRKTESEIDRLSLSDLCRAIESCPKLVVAALHGSILGNSLEMALATHFRVATANSRLGFPEVHWGLIPCAGGTQRMARLIGVRATGDFLLSGRSIMAHDALAMGLVDQLSEHEDVKVAGVKFVKDLLAVGTNVRPTCEIVDRLKDKQQSQGELDSLRTDVARKYRLLPHAAGIVDVLQAAIDRSFSESVLLEREIYAQCLNSPQHKALAHAFLAEREISKIPEARAGRPRLVRQVAVVGGGTMGAGIAIAALDAGFTVAMVERDTEQAEQGRAKVEKVYDALIEKGRFNVEKKLDIMSRFSAGSLYENLAQADLVIEAVFEEISVKKVVFAELDRVCKQGAVLATNTSYLDVDEIARSTSRPQDVIGLHFFSPANIMRLLEIVVPTATNQDVVATAFDVAARLRKVPVRSGVCDGFIGNRIQSKARRAIEYMLEDGASPYQIDEAIRAFGYPMGPFQVADLAGGDIGWATRKRRAATRDPNERYVFIADRICERGWFGQKTGRGYYRYDGGGRSGQEDPEVLAIIEAERERVGIKPCEFTSDEIVRRFLAAMANEGANVVCEGIALRPLDVDVTFLNGFGFPRHRGGPMKYADMIGLESLLLDIRRYAEEDPIFWQPSSLLVELVEQGRNFDSLNRF